MLRFIISENAVLLGVDKTHQTTYVAVGLYKLITTTQLSGARSTN
jgi:hypothetical protein